jgi:hypothetical protein
VGRAAAADPLARAVTEVDNRMSHEMARLLQAATFAADRHRDQRRKNPEASPYINHPLHDWILGENVTDWILQPDCGDSFSKQNPLIGHLVASTTKSY